MLLGDDPVKRERMMLRREGRYPAAVPLTRQEEVGLHTQVERTHICSVQGTRVAHLVVRGKEYRGTVAGRRAQSVEILF